MSSHHYVTYILWQVIDFLKLQWERESGGGRLKGGGEIHFWEKERKDKEITFCLSTHNYRQQHAYPYNHPLSHTHLQINNAQQPTPKHWNLFLFFKFVVSAESQKDIWVQIAVSTHPVSVFGLYVWFLGPQAPPFSEILACLTSLSVSSLGRHFGRRMVRERLSDGCEAVAKRLYQNNLWEPWNGSLQAPDASPVLLLMSTDTCTSFFFFIMSDVFNTHAQIARRWGR